MALYGAEMVIITLNKRNAIQYQKELLHVHNIIPYQHWDAKDLLSEKDDKRYFSNKWDTSTFAMDQHGGNVIGICISFFNKLKDVKSLYIHRLAVSESNRRQGVGTALIARTLVNANDICGLKDLNFFLKTQYKHAGVHLSKTLQAVDFYSAVGMEILESIESKEKSEFLLIGSSEQFLKNYSNYGGVRCS
jgi:N-acetylglutamate synthase-like GNAT family acetyltransferase